MFFQTLLERRPGPPGAEDTPYQCWVENGTDFPGCKMEHNTPDPREGISGFVQGSTFRYFGHYYLCNVPEALSSDGTFPTFEGSYFVYQGEQDVTEQIQLGGKGQYPGGLNAKMAYDERKNHSTFEDIDGWEIFMSADEHLRAKIQEVSLVIICFLRAHSSMRQTAKN